MPELIDKQATLKKMCESCGYCEKFESAMRTTHPDFVSDKCGCYKFLAEQPTIEPEVRHGQWILERTPDGTPYCLHCSECDPDFAVMDNRVATDYCPDCGAEMETDRVYERDDYDGTKKEDET